MGIRIIGVNLQRVLVVKLGLIKVAFVKQDVTQVAMSLGISWIDDECLLIMFRRRVDISPGLEDEAQIVVCHRVVRIEGHCTLVTFSGFGKFILGLERAAQIIAGIGPIRHSRHDLPIALLGYGKLAGLVLFGGNLDGLVDGHLI